MAAATFDGLVRSGVVLITRNNEMIHVMSPGQRKDHLQSNGGVMMATIRLVDLITDVAVPVGMVAMAEAKADLPDGSAAGVFHDGPPIEGKLVLAAFDGFDKAEGKNAAIDGIEFFFEFNPVKSAAAPAAIQGFFKRTNRKAATDANTRAETIGRRTDIRRYPPTEI